MSAYGDMLGSFPELNESFALYARSKNSSGGWDFSLLGTYVGVRQDGGKHSELVNGIVVRTHVYYLWLTKRPEQPNFAVKFNDVWFVAEDEENWSHEGGFYRIAVHKIVGSTASSGSVKTIQGKFA